MKKFVIKVVSILLLAVCLSANCDQIFQRNVTAEKQANKLFCSQPSFAISLLNQLLILNGPTESIVYSPHSVYWTLIIAYFGAGGETEKELKNMLCLDWAKNKSDVEKVYKLKREGFNRFQQRSIEFNSVEKLYVSTKWEIQIRDSFKRILNGDIEALNFDYDLEQSIKYINEFVANTTRNHIKNFITNELTPQTVTAMINAVYFKGQWAIPFDKNHTSRELFYNQAGEAGYVDMMKIEGPFESGFIRDSRTEVLKMPYQSENEEISMFIFLPQFNTMTVDKLLDNLTPEILDDVFSGRQSREYHKYVTLPIEVHFPKFSLEKQYGLHEAVGLMGIKTLFQNANFSDMFKSKGSEFNTRLIHKANIQIDERGSTAAASTVLEFLRSMPRLFNCNHPFVFVIHDQKFNEILFAGIYRGPKQEA